MPTPMDGMDHIDHPIFGSLVSKLGSDRSYVRGRLDHFGILRELVPDACIQDVVEALRLHMLGAAAKGGDTGPEAQHIVLHLTAYTMAAMLMPSVFPDVDGALPRTGTPMHASIETAYRQHGVRRH